ncbi:4Fe-4S ferredoxin [Streptomyces aureoverticillatus]|nr:4Fe-4S ferredoxin [Streptomyces aureoverticillatus]
MAAAAIAVLDRQGLAALVARLVADDRTVVGPAIRDGAVVLAELASADELPFGWGVELDTGRHRLTPRQDGAVFAHSAGPQSWKAFLHPQREQLWSARRGADGVPVFTETRPEPPAYAFLGVRTCDLRAIAVQDPVLAGGPPPALGSARAGDIPSPDRGHRQRRMGALPIAAEFTEPGATRFCVSADGGPAADVPRLLDGVPHRSADLTTGSVAPGAVDSARERVGRSLPPPGLRALLGESPAAERWQRWDSCVDLGFSLLHGRPVRASARSRCRQWLTPKLSTWHDQFGSGGCVGCRRCIAWCPAGSDFTEEVAVLAAERDAAADDRHMAHDDGSAHYDRGPQP